MKLVLEGETIDELAAEARAFLAEVTDGEAAPGSPIPWTAPTGAPVAELPAKRGRGRPPKNANGGAPTGAPVAELPAKRGRGRPPKNANGGAPTAGRVIYPVCQAHAAGVDATKFEPTLVEPHHCSSCKAQPAAKPAPPVAAPAAPATRVVKVEEVQQAMRELIAHKSPTKDDAGIKVGAAFARSILDAEFGGAKNATSIPAEHWQRFVDRCVAITTPSAPAQPSANDLI